MKPFRLYQTIALIIALSTAFTASAAPKACADEIRETNSFLMEQGVAPVNDAASLVSTLQYLTNTGRLPDKYITTEEAKRLGWSGKDSDSLWGLKPTNGKAIGGDAYTSKMLPPNQSWFSADIDVNRGYRSSKHLIYSREGQQRFITTDHYQHFVELEACK